jgi:hypothetical protein
MPSREDEIQSMKQVTYPDVRMLCNHVGFLDRYDWGLTCGNCGAAWVPYDQEKPNAQR